MSDSSPFAARPAATRTLYELCHNESVPGSLCRSSPGHTLRWSGLRRAPPGRLRVELLRASGIRPLWRLIILHALEGQHEPTVEVKSRPALTERPSSIRLVHHATEKRLVEPGQLSNVCTVQHDALQLGDHGDHHFTAPA